jgi:AraC family ethanolamine operon transcriptional activator
MYSRTIRTVHIACTDPDEFRKKSAGWDFEHFQLVRGRYQSSMQVLQTENLQLSLARHSIGTLERGAPPQGACTITLPDVNHAPLYFCGYRLKKDYCPTMLPGEEFEALCQGPNRFINIVVNRSLLERESGNLTGLPFAALTRQKLLKIPHRDQRVLAAQLTLLLRRLAMDALPAGGAQRLERQIVKQVLCSIQPPESRKTYPRLPERRRAAWMAEQVIRKNLRQLPDIDQLSNIVGCAVRTLHLGFKERYGLTPGRYGRILALHAARRDLYTLPRDRTIADIALHWGFHHLGRFSLYYKNLFDELPRQTVEQGRMYASMPPDSMAPGQHH